MPIKTLGLEGSGFGGVPHRSEMCQLRRWALKGVDLVESHIDRRKVECQQGCWALKGVDLVESHMDRRKVRCQ